MLINWLRSVLYLILVLSGIRPGLSQDTGKLLNDYISSHHQEKIYVAHDRDFYAPGETIWCALHLVDGVTHKAFDANPVVYVNWSKPDGEVLGSYILKVVDGTAQFEIQTNLNDEGGDYRLQAYTLYQRNFPEEFIFQKTIPIIKGAGISATPQSQHEEKKISFFPEGGHLVTGVESKVAFRIAGDWQLDSCRVVDNRGESKTSLHLMHEGMGIFSLLPEKGKSYFVEENDGTGPVRYAIPKALTKGYVLSVSTIKENNVSIEIEAGKNSTIDGCRLIGHIRGGIYLDIELNGVNTSGLLVPRTELPSGIVHLTLFDPDGRPAAERLFFNRNEGTMPIASIEMDQAIYQPRSEVYGRIVTELDGQLIPSRMSLSVHKNYIGDEDGQQGTNIVNYLLFQSDLGVHIDNINQYFLLDNRKSRVLLDLLLMNFGWRKFNWQDVLSNKRPDLVYLPEENLSLIGRVVANNSKSPVEAEVILNILDRENFAITKTTTEEDGLFIFKGLEWADTTEILIQAEQINEKKKKKLKEGEIRRTGKKNVLIEMIRLQDFDRPQNFCLPAERHLNSIEVNRFVKSVNLVRQIDSTFNPDWRIDLDEFTVAAQRKTDREVKDSKLKDRYSQIGIPFVASSFKVYMDDLPSSGAFYSDIYDLIRARVPGATVTGSFGAPQRDVYFRGIQSISLPTNANFVVNGVPTDYSLVAAINPTNVLAIDVLRGLYATAFYGERGNGGIISITTREPGDRLITRERSIKGIINMKHPGYYKARSFSYPDYANPSGSHVKPDYRNTLFWSGIVDAREGTSEFSFFTGDETGTYAIVVEGISISGHPFVMIDKMIVEP